MVKSGKRCNVGIWKNGASKANVETDNRGGSLWEMGGHMVILQLNTSDRVWIQSYSCNYIQTGRNSIFSGFQIA